ncbi:hypothetical protein [Brevibacillus sp. 179-C 1.1 NHS]|uniref:hypothetical protein n=1 Tax=Brevibacillus sp. 179-C 1.1 NHS TaxID=3235177 RepID=UPI0039A23B8B
MRETPHFTCVFNKLNNLITILLVTIVLQQIVDGQAFFPNVRSFMCNGYGGQGSMHPI